MRLCFQLELPWRLIRMFSFVGETVLDPFAGSGTTLAAALQLGRSAIGYEIQEHFLPLIWEKVGGELWGSLEIRRREPIVPPVPVPTAYRPFLQDVRPLQTTFSEESTFRVVQAEIEGERIWLTTAEGRRVYLMGIRIPPEEQAEASTYLTRYVRKKRILIRMETEEGAYVYLKNRLFVNRKMIEMGLAVADNAPHKYREKFLKSQIKKEV